MGEIQVRPNNTVQLLQTTKPTQGSANTAAPIQNALQAADQLCKQAPATGLAAETVNLFPQAPSKGFEESDLRQRLHGAESEAVCDLLDGGQNRADGGFEFTSSRIIQLSQNKDGGAQMQSLKLCLEKARDGKPLSLAEQAVLRTVGLFYQAAEGNTGASLSNISQSKVTDAVYAKKFKFMPLENICENPAILCEPLLKLLEVVTHPSPALSARLQVLSEKIAADEEFLASTELVEQKRQEIESHLENMGRKNQEIRQLISVVQANQTDFQSQSQNFTLINQARNELSLALQADGSLDTSKLSQSTLSLLTEANAEFRNNLSQAASQPALVNQLLSDLDGKLDYLGAGLQDLARDLRRQKVELASLQGDKHKMEAELSQLEKELNDLLAHKAQARQQQQKSDEHLTQVESTQPLSGTEAEVYQQIQTQVSARSQAIETFAHQVETATSQTQEHIQTQWHENIELETTLEKTQNGLEQTLKLAEQNLPLWQSRIQLPKVQPQTFFLPSEVPALGTTVGRVFVSVPTQGTDKINDKIPVYPANLHKQLQTRQLEQIFLNQINVQKKLNQEREAFRSNEAEYRHHRQLLSQS